MGGNTSTFIDQPVFKLLTGPEASQQLLGLYLLRIVPLVHIYLLGTVRLH